jgi:hypothetical protein
MFATNNGYQARSQDFSRGGGFDRLVKWSCGLGQNSDFDRHISNDFPVLIVIVQPISLIVLSFQMGLVLTNPPNPSAYGCGYISIANVLN